MEFLANGSCNRLRSSRTGAPPQHVFHRTGRKPVNPFEFRDRAEALSQFRFYVLRMKASSHA